MLRELITWVLNTYLGKYLENFNPAQLSVALLSGEVELENIPIRKDALRSFGIPVQALSGNIGKIKLQVPVRQFRTSPWCITIERIYCVFGPKNLNDWDDEKEKVAEFEYKLGALDAKESKWRSERGYALETYYSSSYSSWLNYGTNLATNIIENIELKINDVHFRYEDTISENNFSFAAGIKIKSLTAQSCDSNWIPASNKTNNVNISYKLIELNDLSVYCDKIGDDLVCSNLPSSDLLSSMSNICEKYPHRYVINPISARAQWKREKCKQVIRSKERPRISCDVLIPEVKISLTDIQYERIVDCLTSLRMIKLIRSYRLKRPSCSVSENPLLWWKYAVECHGYSFLNTKEKWIIMNENIRYTRIYKRLLLNPNENLSKEDKQLKTQVEKLRNLADLELLRDACFENVFTKDLSLKTRNHIEGKGMLFHWFPNWMGWYGNNESAVQVLEQDESIKTLENDILNALENTIEDNSFTKRDAVFGYFTVNLMDGQLLINMENKDSADSEIKFEMHFKKLTSFVQMNPSITSYTVGISLGSVCLLDKLTKGTEFPYLIRPQIEEAQLVTPPVKSYLDIRNIFTKTQSVEEEPWFRLLYENEIQSDFRLDIKSKSLDIIYNNEAFKWLLTFLSKPYVKHKSKRKLMGDENKTKQTFLQNWKQILIGYQENRKTWCFEIEISAPRIIFVENFQNKNSLVVLVDFGRFQLLKNENRKKSLEANPQDAAVERNTKSEKTSEDDEMFMTPCSTPPGSEISYSESPTLCQNANVLNNLFINTDTGLESAFHNKIYNKYIINLTDLQVLVCKNQERWQASFRNSSNYHLLDKFNIYLELEQRIIFTADPEYPSFTLFGNLPKILVHANEQKINDFFKILYPITNDNILMHRSFDRKELEENMNIEEADTVEQQLNGSLIVVQFAIGQMIIEIQSNKKSIAELQIIGARAGMTKRTEETHITMSVHGLLLVDAIQSYGPDFELLVASHRHVGMDSISGSIKHSEPCSPISPASPDPSTAQRPTSPHIIKRAVNTIQTEANVNALDFDESNALITIEMNFIASDKEENSVQITNIAFNNLDVIANQQTVIELMGFMKRTFYAHEMFKTDKHISVQLSNSVENITKEKPQNAFKNCHNEINFHFFRLNILVLHTLERDKFLVARKVGTLTMSEAKIHASLHADVSVTGSLGGIQVIDITPDGVNHQRILSVGKDPLTDPPELHGQDLLSTLTHEMYGNNSEDGECGQYNALNFKITWTENTIINVKVRMASVCYTHCPRFLQDINLCISQFKQHLRNFAKSIRNKATDMAKELVQQIKDVKYSATTEVQKLYKNYSAKIIWDVILSSPVIVLPTSNDSTDVLVANLGEITLNNTHEENENCGQDAATTNDCDTSAVNFWTKETYFVDIRNINLFSLNTLERKGLRVAALPRANEFYSCKSDAVAILHDTAVSFKLSKDSRNILCNHDWKVQQTYLVDGSVTQLLKVSLSRAQYVQVIESIKNATNFTIPQQVDLSVNEDMPDAGSRIGEQDLINHSENKIKTSVQFSVPTFQIDLKNECNDALINIIFREFSIMYDRQGDEEDLQVLLRSVLMEDLKSAVDSSFRNMVNSASDGENDTKYKNDQYSSSCPDLSNANLYELKTSPSMPSNLNACYDNKYSKSSRNKLKSTNLNFCASKMTTSDNLVIYKSHTSRTKHSKGEDKLKTNSSIDFNILNLILSVDRWFMVFDFFGLVSENDNVQHVSPESKNTEKNLDFSSKLEVSIRSLNLILVRNEAELSKVNISSALFNVTKENFMQAIEGRLGSISLYDLTSFGQLYRQKFSTTGPEALSFCYKRLKCEPKNTIKNRSLKTDAVLDIDMSSVRYIHTKRFIMEFHLFVKELLQLQTPVIKKIKMPSSQKDKIAPPFQLGLNIHAESPIILLPASFNSSQVLVADLGKFTLKNSFHFSSDKCVVSKKKDITTFDEVLDVMYIDLVNINLFAGERVIKSQKTRENSQRNSYINVGNFMILKLGDNLFKETCYLKLQVERNTDSHISHNCPDISLKGTLSKLNGVVNLQQYKLIRGFLSYNMGEVIDDVYYNYSYNLCESIEKLTSMNRITQQTERLTEIWNTLSINILLEDVAILLTEQSTSDKEMWPLACINFIESSLEIDLFSDGSQDIDLISSNILVIDSRQTNNASTTTCNVFKHILKPTKHDNPSNNKNIVQAEIHCRKRPGSCKYTIMLNNMRIMAILDYLESLKNYLQEEPTSTVAALSPTTALKHTSIQKNSNNDKDTTEYVLNITDSELIFVENIDKIDTNAIILKSTTVFCYKPNSISVPLSININHLEIFSCTLDAEDESALSIIDPFTLNIELRNNCLNISIQKQLCIRLSYNDIKLFTRMLHSIPKQTKDSKNIQSKKNLDFEIIAPLVAMGFSLNDCWCAMELNNYKLNDAAIWLSQQKQTIKVENHALEIFNVVLNANCVSICIIDDCMDADVPLLEFSFSRLMINQKLKNKMNAEREFRNVPFFLEGNIEAVMANDYYNRFLSGWEPVVEMWECAANWKYFKASSASKGSRLDMYITSKQLLKLNITTTLIELFGIVRKNWTKDYFDGNSTTTTTTVTGEHEEHKLTTFKRRSPFVPFALQNLTGVPLLFKPIFSQPGGGITCTEITQQDLMHNWMSVEHNEITTFDFGHQTKLRHMDSHKLNLHQILVQIHGWTLIGPISIDKVGIYFRYSTLDCQYNRKTRIIFDISLVGSAQKLITVRSALSIVNKLDKRLLLKMEIRDSENKQPPVVSMINPNEQVSIPLRYVESLIYMKQICNDKENQNDSKVDSVVGKTHGAIARGHGIDNEEHGFSTRGISWMDCAKDSGQDLITSCYGPNNSTIFTLVDIIRDKFPYRDTNLPGHTITFLPPLKLKNMLCCDLIYRISNLNQGRINASESISIYNVNTHESFNLSITLDNYKLSGQLKIPMGHLGIVEPKLKLIDLQNRELYLRVSIQSFQGKGMEIYISAPVWIINKTGLPLVYRQEGTNNAASGQFEEHERARQVSPLMFSFSDQEGSPALEIRLGNGYDKNNSWCKSFSIHKELIFRELKAEREKGCYVIGINVRRGRGIYACTTFVTLSPRYQLHNKTGFKLEFAQKCDISRHAPVIANKVISAPVDCNFPFHWPNSDREPLLCVRIADVEFCCWSYGIPINDVQSLYINIRNEWGEMFFLRLEVISKAASYILLFSDAHTLPPPIRIDNYSEVVIHFSQCGGAMRQWQTTVRSQSSLAYVMDDQLGSHSLLIEAPGGNSIEFPINKLDIAKSLTYSNFIYIAFHETFKELNIDEDHPDIAMESQQLVLGVKDRKVLIMRKKHGDRSQLWLMNSNGQLEHEGSSPPTDPFNNLQSPENSATRMVLDLEKPPNPTEFTCLVIRPPNKQRITTQTWRFEDGRLMCHANMCVQARDGVYGLRPGCDAVLGRIESKSRITNAEFIPFEQCIRIQKLRPGSGHLEIISKMDGPIRTIQIHDIKTRKEDIMLAPDTQWNHASINNKKIIDEAKKSIFDECSVRIELLKGVGISIITRHPCEELAYLTLENLSADILSTQFEKSLDFKVFYLQVDNQLLDTSCPVLLHTSKAAEEDTPTEAFILRVKILPSPNENAVMVEYLTFDMKPCIVYLEERLILKSACFFGLGKSNQHSSKLALEYDTTGWEVDFFSKNSRRYYFEHLNIGSSQVRLSMITAPKLTYEMLETKKALGLTLIKFEDALIEFDKFSDRNHFETLDVYLRAIREHYINQIKWHAASILGSVDFLGNPLGFANDLSEGVSGLIFEGSVKSLVKNVTHGISNSTAKLTETLSDSLGRVVLDEHDNETRQKMLEIHSNTSGNHLAAGLKGFGYGLLGGVTSIVRHTYVGAQADGFPGFLSGLGKGLVGTVTKPIIGVLDLASETASAVRETSRGSHRSSPDRKRLPRCVTGAHGGLLPSYSYRQSKGQQYLYVINRRNFTEKLIAYEPNLCNNKEAKLRLLVSTEYVRVFSLCDEEPAITFECHLSEVLSCHPLTTNAGPSATSSSKMSPSYYIEISINIPKINRPRVRCQSEEIAEVAARCINYAKSVFDEREHSVQNY